MFKGLPFPLFLTASLPFFAAYKIAIALGKGSTLQVSYTAIALLSSVGLSAVAIQSFGSLKNVIYPYRDLFKQHRVFVYLLIGIFIFFCVRGLYLEYPGDAIAYLQRIGQANQDGAMSLQSLWTYSSVNTFFSSLQQWLVGSDYELRTKLRLIAALSACILCLATYRLALWCTQHKPSSILAVLLFLGFYGNLQISFFLYKILQGATLAMIVYLEIIPYFYSFLSNTQFRQLFTARKSSELLVMALATWVCLDCHKEKVFYLFAITLSYVFFAILMHIRQKKRPPIFSVFIFLLLAAFLIRLFALDRPPLPGYYSPLVKTWFLIGNHHVFTYWPIEANSSLLFLEFIVIALAIMLLSSYRPDSKEFFMAAIAIAPFLLFINPIVVTGLIKIASPNNLYRLMIGGLPWVFLPLACHTLQREHSIKLRYLPILFAFFGLFAYAPIYGKLPHLLNRVPTYADGRDLTPAIEYLLDESKQSEDASLSVMAPPYVNSYLAAWPNLTVSSDRWINNDVNIYGPDLAYFYSSEITADEITGVISNQGFDVIVIDRRDDLNYQSWLGRMTQHWAPDLIPTQQALFAGNSLRDYLENQPQPLFEKTLEQHGFQVYQAVAQSQP